MEQLEHASQCPRVRENTHNASYKKFTPLTKINTISKLKTHGVLCNVWIHNDDCFQSTFLSQEGGIAVIEDSILEVLKKTHKPRVLFLRIFF